MPNDSSPPSLIRAIGRWSLVALVVNSIIGSGIFGLPGDIAKLLGPAAPWAYLIAAVGIGIIMAVHAELASQFSDAGGPYLYAREAFGRLCGIQMGWFAWLVRVTSGAANANLFVIYFGEFWRNATSPWPRALLLIGLIGGLAVVNIRGVRGGARISNLLTAAKLVPLGALIVAGLLFVHRPASIAAAADPSLASWSNAVMALIFAFGGFEMALIPMAEAKNPRRDAPFALFTGLAIVTTVYALIQIITMWSVPDLAGRTRPLADAARGIIGPAGAGLIALGAMLSTYGHLSAQLVSTPRLTYAMAQNGDLPPALAAVHPRFRTPYLSIVLWAVVVIGLAIYGSFIWNAILSAAGRLLTYSIGCAALIRFRHLRPTADAFRLPAGTLFAVLGMVFCLAMIFRMNAEHAKIILTITVVAAVNWLVVRRRAQREARPGV